ncbi:hypothetical protein EV356DRAFT_535022 [Viridothelium virens]|uniref:Uncharacterized protein n=1 Tax=Viridothelium virens TaxID=1048519 RepID=A0A6A6H396_VIRVR|nr:hypothetical protein EV356DRAFT_535022 [Viridothelium virens]
MAQPTPGLEITGPDDTMELTSELGAYTQDDIDIDIDLTGSGMKSPSHYDDYMIEDYKSEIDIDTNLITNDLNQDDDIMADDSKVQDNIAAASTVVPDEELRDISDLGQDDFGAAADEIEPEHPESAHNDLTQQYDVTTAEPNPPVNTNINDTNQEDDLLDFSDEDEEDIIAQPAGPSTSGQVQAQQASEDEATTTLAAGPVGESPPLEGSVPIRDHQIDPRDSRQHAEVVSSYSGNDVLGKRSPGEGSKDDDPHYDTRRSSPSKLPSLETAATGDQVIQHDPNAQSGRDDDQATGQPDFYEENHATDTEKSHAEELLGADYRAYEDYNSGELNAVADHPADEQDAYAEELEGDAEDFEDADEDADEDEGDDEGEDEGEEDAYVLSENGKWSSKPLPIPVIIQYDGGEYSLFQSSAEKYNHEFFLRDDSHADSSLSTLLGACHNLLGETIPHECELVMEIQALGLRAYESCLGCTYTTLREVMDTYVTLMRNDGVEDPEPIHATLFLEFHFKRRLQRLIQAAKDGTGFSKMAVQVSESCDENATAQDTEDADQTGHGHGQSQTKDHSQTGVLQFYQSPEGAKEHVQGDENHQTHGSEIAKDSVDSPAEIGDVSSNKTAAAPDDNSLKVEVDASNQLNAGSDLNATQNLSNEEGETAGPVHQDRGQSQPQDSQLAADEQFGYDLGATPGSATGSGDLPAGEQAAQEPTGEQDELTGDLDFDFDGTEEYQHTTGTLGLDAGNEIDEDFSWLDEDITAVEGRGHETDTGIKDNGADEIFDEIDFEEGDELLEVSNGEAAKTTTQAASSKLQPKRSWDEQNADSLEDTEEHDPKRVRS